MKNVARFLFDTWYGAATVFAVALAGWFVGVAFSCLAVGEAVAHVFGLFLALSAVALVAAFVRSLWKRAWSRAAAQFGMFVLGQVAFFGVAMGAMVASEAVADWRGPGPWQESREKNGVVPFEVEYRIARFPPMFSGSQLTLDRRVAFVSGKRVELGGGPAWNFEVYALEDGAFGVADPVGNRYRVDATAETVEEELAEGVWGALLGKFLPDGHFETVAAGEGGRGSGMNAGGRAERRGGRSTRPQQRRVTSDAVDEATKRWTEHETTEKKVK